MILVTLTLFFLATITVVLTDLNVICEEFNSNQDVLASFGYPVPIINDINDNEYLTYAKTNNENEIIFLQISNQLYIPPIIFCLYYLDELRIIRTNSFSIQHFPRIIRRLFISHIHIPSNFDNINKLFYLEDLTIKHTNLEFIPYIGSLHRLTFLTLNDNNLNSLPISIKRLKTLKRLDVTNNRRLQSLDPINGHQKLERIIASYCSIESLPQQLPQLQMLYLNNNSLKSLDNIETLGQYVKTPMILIFEKNQIKIIPKQIIQVQNIHTLNLRENRIGNIQINYLCQLKNLKNLLINHNPLEQPFSNRWLKKCLPNITIS